MRSYRTFPPLPSGLRSDGKGGKVPIPAESGRCGELITIMKRNPSFLFTQLLCAWRARSSINQRGGPIEPCRGDPLSRFPRCPCWGSQSAISPYRHSVTLPAVYLCCTFPEVAFGGRYPLSLPCGARTFLMDGLSACPRDCLSSSQGRLYPMRRRKSTRKISGSRCIFALSVVSFSSYEPPHGGGTKGAIP